MCIFYYHFYVLYPSVYDYAGSGDDSKLVKPALPKNKSHFVI